MYLRHNPKNAHIAANLQLLLMDKESESINTIRQADGRLPAYSPGGYPFYYLARDDMGNLGNHNNVLCPKHANEEELKTLAAEDYDPNDPDSFKVWGYEVNYEDDDLWCEYGHRIKSAYGDDDDDDDYDDVTRTDEDLVADSDVPVGEDFDTFDEWLGAVWKQRADVVRAAGAQLLSEPEHYRITVQTSTGDIHVVEGDDLVALIEDMPEGVSPEDYAIVILSELTEEE